MMRALDRFDEPIYTLTEVGRYLRIPAETVRRWAGNRPDSALITAMAGRSGDARVPFVGLAEAYTLRAFRDAGVPLQRIRPALALVERELGVAYALASQRLYTDGAEVLLEVANQLDEEGSAAARRLVVVRNGQYVLHEVVADYLRQVTFADGYAQVIPLPAYGDARVLADARRSFGQPIFASSGVRLEDVIGLFEAGEPLAVVCKEFGVSERELEAALRSAA